METEDLIRLSKTALKRAIKIYPVEEVTCADGKSRYDVNMVLRLPYAGGYDDALKDYGIKVEDDEQEGK